MQNVGGDYYFFWGRPKLIRCMHGAICASGGGCEVRALFSLSHSLPRVLGPDTPMEHLE